MIIIKTTNNILRTNNSDDDLVWKDKIEAIHSHKTIKDTKSIMKWKQKWLNQNDDFKNATNTTEETKKKNEKVENSLFHKIKTGNHSIF